MSRVVTATGPYGRHHSLVLRAFEMRDALIKNAGHALPGIEVIKADLLKRYENQEFVVDLALVDFSSSRWWVGRVVSQVDDFDHDVLIPNHALRRTSFLVEDSEALASGTPNGKADSVRAIVLDQVPEVVTFVSRPEPAWFDALARAEGHLAVLETFSNAGGDTLIRVNGDVPRAQGERVSECHPIPGTAHLLKLPNQAARWPKEMIAIEYEGETLRATANIVGTDVILDVDPQAGSAAAANHALWCLADGYFEIRRDTHD
jgi:hypothetical protein